jgi:glycosyltransferase involved in cell wall biosynthesis
MKKILVLNFFPAFTPPSSGGELRYFYLYKNLSNYFDITLLSPTHNNSKPEIIEHTDTFREYRIPKEDIHNQIHWKLEKEKFSPEFSALTCAYSGEYLNEYHKYYLQLYKSIDIVIHDFPYMLNYDLFFGIDNKPRIYNSHNLEYDLLKQIYTGSNAAKHLDYIFELERKLIVGSQLIFATSNIEKNKFQELYKIKSSKIRLAPNGINPEDFLIRDDKIQRKTAFFIGSGHPPNTQAVEFILNKLAPDCPDITFLIAGTCCGTIQSSQKNVKLFGKVDEQQKDLLFKTSDIAINPMFSGAGTNLKTLEYLSMGIPMISTDVGARGIDLQENEHFILANKDNFAEKLNSLVNNIDLKEKISQESKRYINKNFNWGNIAANVYSEIINIEVRKQKNLLLLNDFEVSKPFGGGEIRINKLYSELSKTYNVLLLCLNGQNGIGRTWITDKFLEISFPKTEEHLKEEEIINYEYQTSATDIVNSYMISRNDLFMSALKAIVSDFDAIVLCHPYMYESIIGEQYKYLIYESLNYELLLKKELLSGHPSKDKLLRQTEKIECGSSLDSNLIISVSDADHIGLKSYDISKEMDIVTIKNGVEIIQDPIFETAFTSIKSIFAEHSVILFIGSAHTPNIDSARFILESLAVEMSDCYFIIIGSVCDALTDGNIPSNVLLFGKLNDDYKNVLLSVADIAINPMFGGSGSNLKLAEYFAWKLPTITTEFGARGYNIQNGKEAIVCDVANFSNNITKLQNDKRLTEALAFHAFKYVQSNIEWSILGKQYSNLLDNKIFNIQRKKLLIITYRFTNPPLGGAEVYLYELLKGLDEIEDLEITVAYLDSYDIENQYHFSINATHSSGALQNNFKHVTFKKFIYNELSNNEKFENSKILMKNLIGEFLICARTFIHCFDQSILLGGWNFPEKLNDFSQIWSSAISEVYAVNTKNMVFSGSSPSKKQLILKMGNDILFNKEVNGTFKIKVSLPGNGIITLECKEEYAGEDIRPLGVLINSIVFDNGELDLLYCYRNFLKDDYLSEYIDELIRIATQRDKKLDDIFQETRGLNSSELETYLDENVEGFDMLLGHSVPFSTTPITSKYALKYNKPYALLPHYHFDDEFYHWQSYYEAFKNADTVFASPTVSIDYFYNKLNIRTTEVPGGGINKSEYDSINSKEFLRLYKSDKPYFLFLGRKSGTKNYISIIDAIEKVNNNKYLCNLVMIGRDEDGMNINSKYTYYLGEQPRDIVLGALKECNGLITMSESESFGIVILEAWMLKKPVVISNNCPAFVELVDENIDGLYTDKQHLSEKIKLLLENKDIANSLGASGYDKTHFYHWQEIAKKINNSLLALV